MRDQFVFACTFQRCQAQQARVVAEPARDLRLAPRLRRGPGQARDHEQRAPAVERRPLARGLCGELEHRLVKASLADRELRRVHTHRQATRSRHRGSSGSARAGGGGRAGGSRRAPAGAQGITAPRRSTAKSHAGGISVQCMAGCIVWSWLILAVACFVVGGFVQARHVARHPVGGAIEHRSPTVPRVDRTGVAPRGCPPATPWLLRCRRTVA